LEVRTIMHLFCENVSGNSLPWDMANLEHFTILDPFANGVFAKLDVPGGLWGHIVGPFHAGIIVVVENGGGIDVRNSVTGLGNALREIPEVKYFLGGCVCSSDLGFAGTKGGTFLVLAEPSDGAPVFEDDSAVQAAEFE
jgi:hypothetical protein